MKQQLTEALAVSEALLAPGEASRLTIEQIKDSRRVVNTAARLVERLLPGECKNCKETPGTVDVVAGFADCPACHGSGLVWDEGIVEAVAKALKAESVQHSFRLQARAVLSAIAQLAEAGSQ